MLFANEDHNALHKLQVQGVIQPSTFSWAFCDLIREKDGYSFPVWIMYIKIS